MIEGLRASSSPHLRQPRSISGIMVDVCIALLPAALYGVFQFGWNAAHGDGGIGVYRRGHRGGHRAIFHKPRTIHDFSAVVTGMLVGMSCPPTVPFWIPMIGSFFAIAVVKMLFGGLGYNFMNPAVTARAVLLASWPGLMTNWQFLTPAEAVASATTTSQATPIAALHYGTASTYGDLFLGNVAGCIGEVSKLLLLLGAAYLVIRGVIRLYTPVALLGTLFLLTWAFGGDAGLFTGDGLYAILSGSAIICAFFMATDYTTSPVTGAGQAIMGFGVGLIIFIIPNLWGLPRRGNLRSDVHEHSDAAHRPVRAAQSAMGR